MIDNFITNYSSNMFRNLWILWMLGITMLSEITSSESFGLTRKSFLGHKNYFDAEAVFLAGDNATELFWNEKGYYTAPSNGYTQIDMSPQPNSRTESNAPEEIKSKTVSRRHSDANLKFTRSNGKTTNEKIAHQTRRENGLVMQDPEKLWTRRFEETDTYHTLPRIKSARNKPYHLLPFPTYIPLSQYQKRSFVPRHHGYRPKVQRYGRLNRKPLNVAQIRRVPIKRPGLYRRFAHTRSEPGLAKLGGHHGDPKSKKTIEKKATKSESSIPLKRATKFLKQRSYVSSFRDPMNTISGASRSHSQNDQDLLLNTKNDQERPHSFNFHQRNFFPNTNFRGKIDHDNANKKRHVIEVMGRSRGQIKSFFTLQNWDKSQELLQKHLLEMAIPREQSTSSVPDTTVDINQISNRNISEEISAIMRSPLFRVNEQSFNSDKVTVENKTIPLVDMVKAKRKKAKAKCEKMKLSRKQERFCRKDPGMPQVLEEATRKSVAECQYQFRFERWNCSTGRTRIRLLSKVNRETAFLFAISSAGLVHTVAKACAQGTLERCSCDEAYSDNINQEAWIWGGCGDNVQYAARFSRQFLKSKTPNRDTRAQVNKHNSDMGIRTVKQMMKQTCKCHGVSGSCTTKTCWRKVAPFYDIGNKIKKAYHQSIKVRVVNTPNGRPELFRLHRHRRDHSEPPVTKSSPTNSTRKPSSSYSEPRLGDDAYDEENCRESKTKEYPRNNELIYLENSPGYCTKSRYSLGTRGRICNKEENCNKICCNRGYKTHTRIVRKSCNCEVKWCCYVKCETCTEKKDIFTCK